MLQFFAQLLKINKEPNIDENSVEHINNETPVEINNADNDSLYYSCQSYSEEVSALGYVGEKTEEKQKLWKSSESSLNQNVNTKTSYSENPTVPDIFTVVTPSEIFETNYDLSDIKIEVDLQKLNKQEEILVKHFVDAGNDCTIENKIEYLHKDNTIYKNLFVDSKNTAPIEITLESEKEHFCKDDALSENLIPVSDSRDPIEITFETENKHMNEDDAVSENISVDLESTTLIKIALETQEKRFSKDDTKSQNFIVDSDNTAPIEITVESQEEHFCKNDKISENLIRVSDSRDPIEITFETGNEHTNEDDTVSENLSVDLESTASIKIALETEEKCFCIDDTISQKLIVDSENTAPTDITLESEIEHFSADLESTVSSKIDLQTEEKHIHKDDAISGNVFVDSERTSPFKIPSEMEDKHIQIDDTIFEKNSVDSESTTSLKITDHDHFIEEKTKTCLLQVDHSFPSTIQQFDRELFMLNIVFPELKKFAQLKSCGILGNIWKNPNLNQQEIFCRNNHMENYKIWSRTKSMDLNHMILVLSTLGRWHGSILAFRDQKPEIFQKFSEKLYNVLPKLLATENLLKVIIKNMEKMMGILEKKGYNDLVEKFMKKVGTFGDIILRGTVEHSVIAFHADCWIDNIIFMYQSLDTSNFKPVDMYFSNFQLSMMDSPIRDLSYIIYIYSDKFIIQDFDFLLQVYHNALSDAIIMLGSDADTIFSFEQMKKDWKKYGMFGVIMSLFEMFDDDEILLDEEEKSRQNAPVDFKVQEQYNRKVVDVFVHYGENFL